jgi:hypothetical protein
MEESGLGEEVHCMKMPLSSVLSPLLRRGERKNRRATPAQSFLEPF